MTICNRPLFHWFRKEVVYNNLKLNDNNNDDDDDDDDKSSIVKQDSSQSILDMRTIGSIDDDTSSVFLDDGFKMQFHHYLRMYTCEHHQATIVMSAIRHNDLRLMELIMKQSKESEDIDFENKLGDTALTLACRLGMYDFVVLLIEHTADVNKETTNGRTALIEATKNKDENIAVIEYLIRSGAIVNYRTEKHHKTALDWAKLLKRRASIRILDLAGTVQKQSTQLFLLISNGKFDDVYEMIKDGEFFDPNGEDKCYAEMMKNGDLEDLNHHQANAIYNSLEKQKPVLAKLYDALNKVKMELAVADEDLTMAFKSEDHVKHRISAEFSIFESISLKLEPVDILEVIRVKSPGYLLRLAMFSYGIIFDILQSDGWSLFTPCNKASSMKWLPVLHSELFKATEATRKIQSFTVSKVQSGKSEAYFQRVKLLFDDFVESFNKQKLGILSSFSSNSGSKPGSAMGGSSRNLSFAGSFVDSNIAKVAQFVASNVNAMDDDSSTVTSTGHIKDEDWDSEAEDAGGGQWIMGEWVSISKKKRKMVGS